MLPGSSPMLVHSGAAASAPAFAGPEAVAAAAKLALARQREKFTAAAPALPQGKATAQQPQPQTPRGSRPPGTPAAAGAAAGTATKRSSPVTTTPGHSSSMQEPATEGRGCKRQGRLSDAADRRAHMRHHGPSLAPPLWLIPKLQHLYLAGVLGCMASCYSMRAAFQRASVVCADPPASSGSGGACPVEPPQQPPVRPFHRACRLPASCLLL